MLAKANGHAIDQTVVDIAMMQRCIALSATALAHGEFPFAALVCRGNEVVVEATNEVARSGDVTRHAEIIAISEAQKALGRKDLGACTIYSNVEPCVMCSFPMRETSIGRVVFAINSPIMGGFSKWSVLRDGDLSRAMPEAFGPAPEIVCGLLQREAEKVWWTWNPLIWAVIKQRGCFGSETADHVSRHMPALPGRRSLMRRLLQFRHQHHHSA